MAHIPFQAVRYLRKLAEDQFRPLIIEVDGEFQVLSLWGDPTPFGLEALAQGMDCRDLLPVAYSFDFEVEMEMPFIGMLNGGSAHLHWLPESEAKGVLICLDASEEHDRQRALQQVANDQSILNYRKTQLADQLREADQLKSRFIAGMSHEFRTPLTSIQGYAGRLKRNADEEQLKALNAIERGSRHLLGLVDNLLAQGRMNAGEAMVHPTDFRIRELGDDIRAIFEPLAASKGLAFDVTGSDTLPALVRLDGLRLRQVIVNLLGNAMKFTESGSVTVQLCWADGRFRFAVSDTGPGIPEDAREKIFQPFGRTGEQNQAGAGLGLAISKTIVEQMDGALALDTEFGKGSTFSAEVAAPELEASDDAAEDGDAVSNIDLSAFTILLAEDDPDVAQLLIDYLGDTGARVLHKLDGADALASARAEKPDLIITDRHLPSMTGLEMVRTLRGEGVHVPVIAHTGSAQDAHRREASEAGCNLYLVKPVDMDRLVEIVAEQLKARPKRQVAETAARPTEKPAKPAAGSGSGKLAMLLKMYEKSLPGKLTALTTAWTAGEAAQWAQPERDELQTQVHKLAGSARSYGYASIGEIAARMDAALMETTTDAGSLADEFAALSEALAKPSRG